MEINVTHLINEDCSQWSDSIANSGLQNIGQVTWRNACKATSEAPLVSEDQQSDLRDWFCEFGAWSRGEIKKMSNEETNALLLQFVAGDIREMESFDTYEAFQKAAEAGRCSSNLYKDDNGEWFFYVGI